MNSVLVRRQKEKAEGGSHLRNLMYKLTRNSFYGFSYVEASRFHSASITKLASARRKLTNPNLVRAVPVGVDEDRELLVLTLCHQPDKRIVNAAQVACQVLSCSKLIFLSQLLILLRCLDPRMAELAYMDTDCAVFWTVHQELADNVREHKRKEFDDAAHLLFADGESYVPQNGKWEKEGRFCVAFFRGNKVSERPRSAV